MNNQSENWTSKMEDKQLVVAVSEKDIIQDALRLKPHLNFNATCTTR